MVDDKAKNEDDVFENSTGATAQACGLFSEAFALGVGLIWTGYMTNDAGLGATGWSLAVLLRVAPAPVLLETSSSNWEERTKGSPSK